MFGIKTFIKSHFNRYFFYPHVWQKILDKRVETLRQKDCITVAFVTMDVAMWKYQGLYDLLKKKLKNVNGTAIAAVVAVVTLLVPIQMASQTWDDHDRSGRYVCRDFGQNYLMSLQEEGNPIIFTNGDNDTFPLWYNQDVESVRTDARVCNLSYLQTDWYIDQMCRPAYDSPSVPITWPRLDYCSGTNEYVEVNPGIKNQLLEFYQENPEVARQQFGDEPFELKNILKYWVRSKEDNNHVIPTDTVYVTIDKEAVKKSGMMMASDSIPDKMVISLAGKRSLYKGDLMMLEMISQCNWTRPVYVAITVGQENYMNLGDNFVQEGLANRITPFTTKNNGAKNFDTEKVYKNMMTRFKFGGIEKKGIYIDETVMRMCYTHRRLFAQLALHLIAEGKKDKALKVLNYAEKVIPTYNVPMNYLSGGLDMAKAYNSIGQKEKARQLLTDIFKNAHQYMVWYTSLDNNVMLGYQQDCIMNIYIMQNCIQEADNVDTKFADKLYKQLEEVAGVYQSKGGQIMEN